MESTPEQAAEGIALAGVIASVLERLVSSNVPHAVTDPGQITKFHALKAPGISIFQYLERIHKYAACSNECFIFSLIYIDRLIQCNNFLLTDLNIHRVVITAILLAAKFFDDAYYNNAYYAKVGGVLVSEMNGLEVDFLFRINFTLHVTPELFQKYREELMSHTGAGDTNNGGNGSGGVPQKTQPGETEQHHPKHVQAQPYNNHTSQQQASMLSSSSSQSQIQSSDAIMYHHRPPTSSSSSSSLSSSSSSFPTATITMNRGNNRPTHITPSPPDTCGGGGGNHNNTTGSRLSSQRYSAAQEVEYHHHNHNGFHQQQQQQQQQRRRRRRDTTTATTTTTTSWGPMAIAGMSGS